MADQELELDLRPYILLLFRYWYLILFATIVAAVAAFIVTAFLPPYYEATALIAITKPNYTLEFDPRIQTSEGQNLVYKAYPEIAQSSDVISMVYTALDPAPEGIDSPSSLAKHMEAESGADPSLLHLTVTMPSPQEAAHIANTWAAIFVQHAHNIYGNQTEGEVRFFEAQLAQNLIELAQAEQAVITFEATNDLAILRNELNSLVNTHLLYLNQQRDNEFVIRDLEGLQQNLLTQNRSTPASFADQLSLLSLQTAAYAAGNRLPVDLQLVDTTTLSDQTVGDQLRVIGDLITTLQDNNVANSLNIETITPKITALQENIKVLETDETRLNRNLSVKRDMDTALSRKVEEASLTNQEEPGEFRNAGDAIPPEEPNGPSKMINTAAAGIVAAILCVTVLFFREFMQNGLGLENTTRNKSEASHLYGGNGGGITDSEHVSEHVQEEIGTAEIIAKQS